MQQPTLEEMMQSDETTAEQLFGVDNIAAEIRNTLYTFVQYCCTHKTFSLRMIELGLNISYQELTTEKLKLASHSVIQILGSEESQIVALFLGEPTEKVEETSLKSQAKRLFEINLPPRKIELARYQLARASLKILAEDNKNETCIGHIHKIFAFLIRSQPNQMLQFLKLYPVERGLLLQHIGNCSISNLISQLLACEDRTKKYLYADLKEDMMKCILNLLIQKMADEQFYDGALVLIEQILSSIKQTHFQYFQDFQRIAVLIANQDIIKKLYEGLSKEETFYNASRYLQILVHQAQQVVEDDDGFEVAQKGGFQINLTCLSDNLPFLNGLLPNIEHYPNVTKISFITFLTELYTEKIALPPLDKVLTPAYNAFDKELKAGIYKTKLYNLIAQITKLASQQQIAQWLKDYKINFTTTFKTITNSFGFKSESTYNCNQNIAYMMSLCSKIITKDASFWEIVQKETGKDVNKITKKYETKIANFQKNGSSFEQESSELLFQFSAKDDAKNIPGPYALNMSLGNKFLNIPTLEMSKPSFDNLMKDTEETTVNLNTEIWGEAKSKFHLRHKALAL